MPVKKGSARKHNAEVPKLMREPASHVPTKRRTPNSDVLSGLEDLDDDTLLSLSLDAPARLTPPPGNGPLSKVQVSTEVMEATLDRLGFGPPNDLSDLPISISTTPTSSAASEPVLTGVETSGTDDSDAYDQITGLFQQVAQRTGQSVNTIILEWALLHAHTDLVKRRVAHGHISNAMSARQEAFEEEVNKVIELVGGSSLFNVLGY
jgi:hypothetical protein